MAYSQKNSKGQTYYLHGKMVELRGGRKQKIHWFGKEAKENAMDAIPEGYETMENDRTGLIMLRKKK